MLIPSSFQPELGGSTPSFFIDSNCLMTPYNQYFNPTFELSQRFWNRIAGLIQDGTIGLLDKVYDETYGHESDQLDTWLKTVKPKIIRCDTDPGILTGYQKVLQHVASTTSGYQEGSFKDWTDEKIADPWLIGSASEYHSSIITFEKRQNLSDKPWKHLKIPTVADALGLECVDLFDFMKSDGTF
jgi:hypothetical protein